MSAGDTMCSGNNECGDLLKKLENHQDRVRVNAAQDYIGDKMYYGVLVADDPYLIGSDRDVCSFKEVKNRGLRLSTDTLTKSGVSRKGLENFLKGTVCETPLGTFNKIWDYLKRYVYLRNKAEYSLLSTWVMGTYIFRIFRYFPYIHLNGEKGSGKTLLLDLLKPICFNGSMLTSATPAVLFRSVEIDSPTLFIDEVENLRGQDREARAAVMEVLRSGFHASGMVQRMGGDNYEKVQTFATYSPKMLAGINELDDVLGDRTVPIRMYRRLPHEPVQGYRRNSKTESLQGEIVDELYRFGWRHGPAIAKAYRDEEDGIRGLSHLENRERDLWTPLVAIANLLDQQQGRSPGVTDLLITLSEQIGKARAAEDRSENDTVKMLAVLSQMVKEVPAWNKSVTKLRYDPDVVVDYFAKQEIYSYPLTKGQLTRRLGRLDVKSEPTFVDGRTRRQYIIDLPKLKELSQRYGVAAEA